MESEKDVIVEISDAIASKIIGKPSQINLTINYLEVNVTYSPTHFPEMKQRDITLSIYNPDDLANLENQVQSGALNINNAKILEKSGIGNYPTAPKPDEF